MAAATKRAPTDHFRDRPDDLFGVRTVPILAPTIQMPAPSLGDPMDIVTPTHSSAPPSTTKSPDADANGMNDRSGTASQNDRSADGFIMPAPAAAAPAVHQPKIVQTAFIHKLYK